MTRNNCLNQLSRYIPRKGFKGVKKMRRWGVRE